MGIYCVGRLLSYPEGALSVTFAPLGQRERSFLVTPKGAQRGYARVPLRVLPLAGRKADEAAYIAKGLKALSSVQAHLCLLFCPSLSKGSPRKKQRDSETAKQRDSEGFQTYKARRPLAFAPSGGQRSLSPLRGPLCYICPKGVPKDSEGPLAHNCLPGG